MMMGYGGESNTSQVRSMLLKSPREAWRGQVSVGLEWRQLNYLGEPDYATAAHQHEALANLIRRSGAEVHLLPEADSTGLDSVYVHDPVLITGRGAILCRMGKPARESEPEAAHRWLEELDIPIFGSIHAPGTLEGGDVVWLGARTVAVGEGYRTNADGIRQLRTLLGDLVDEVVRVPLPHWTGPRDCLHLMSILSPVAADLSVVYSRLMPVPFRQLLIERGVELVEVPDEEYDTMACNVLALAPRHCVMLAGNPRTQAALAAAGAQVWTFDGSEICLKGGGGPTCLTRALLRL